MKKKMTTLLAMLLCTILTIAGICTDTAYAAEKTPLKVTFNKKTVTLAKDINTKPAAPKVKTLNKKWGKPEKSVNDYGSTFYTWDKGKTTVYYYVSNVPKTERFGSERTYMQITSTDKKFAVNGIKVGMKQKKTEKILKNLGMNDDEFLESGIRITCSYEKGKVSSIFVNLENL